MTGLLFLELNKYYQRTVVNLARQKKREKRTVFVLVLLDGAEWEFLDEIEGLLD